MTDKAEKKIWHGFWRELAATVQYMLAPNDYQRAAALRLRATRLRVYSRGRPRILARADGLDAEAVSLRARADARDAV